MLPLKSLFNMARLFAILALFIVSTIHAEKISEDPGRHAKSQPLIQSFLDLDQLYQETVASVLSDNHAAILKRQGIKNLSSTLEIDEMYSVLRDLEKADDFTALAYIYKNIKRFKDSIGHPDISLLIGVLLKYNDRITATSFRTKALAETDDYQIALINMQFSEYFFQRNEWNSLLQHLNFDTQALLKEQVDRANLLRGIALQKLKRHRESIDYYNRIPKESNYFQLTQLNKAIGYIRQGWWTDAHAIIKKLIIEKPPGEKDEFTNRLYLILGHSLLRNEYYRESRQAFRNITLDSQYLIKALMGISLVAIKQRDYAAALNTLSIIKEKPDDALEVFESYLLLPTVYQNLGQNLTANSAYETAITYLETQKGIIETLLYSPNLNSIPFSIIGNSTTVKIDNIKIDLSSQIPNHLVSNCRLIDRILTVNASNRFTNDLVTIKSQCKTAINSIVRKALSHKKVIIESYLSQVRFGLAKLYDSEEE